MTQWKSDVFYTIKEISHSYYKLFKKVATLSPLLLLVNR